LVLLCILRIIREIIVYIAFKGDFCMNNKSKKKPRLLVILGSMGFAIGLLVVIALLSIIGTVIPQNLSLDHYVHRYGEVNGYIIKFLSIDDVYHSWWYASLILMLCGNIVLCSISRLPQIINRMKGTVDIDKMKSANYYRMVGKLDPEGYNKLLKNTKLNKGKVNNVDGQRLITVQRGRIGHLGSWITHLSIIIITLCYAGGKIYGYNTFVYGVPGTIQEIPGTNYSIALDDFNIDYRDDQTVNQYYSKIRLFEGKKELQSKEIYVNNPLSHRALNIVQSGTGWAVDASIYRGEQRVKEETMYHKDILEQDDIALWFYEFYPDYDDTKGRPVSTSNMPNNPRILFMAYLGGYMKDMTAMAMGESRDIGEYKVTFDNARRYTVLQIVSDPFRNGALFGGILMMMGLFMSFYINPSQVGMMVDKRGNCHVFGNWALDKDRKSRILEEKLGGKN
jgi:cytochrome c biogenesis protein